MPIRPAAIQALTPSHHTNTACYAYLQVADVDGAANNRQPQVRGARLASHHPARWPVAIQAHLPRALGAIALPRRPLRPCTAALSDGQAVTTARSLTKVRP